MQTPALTGLANVLPGTFDNARIVVPDEPVKDDIGAASAVSARLGATLTGMMLPPVAKASQVDLAPGIPDRRPLILVGLNQPRIPAALRKRIAALKETQGLAAWADGSIAIAGPAPLGTRIAAEAFAGRSPYFWDRPGKDANTTFAKVAADLTAALAGVTATAMSFDEIVFERGRDEAVSATITVTVARGSVPTARRALEKTGGALRYSGVQSIVIRLTDGQATDTVTIEPL